MYSKDGYKRYSKDRNNLFNIIPSGNITMEDVDFPVLGIDNLGYSELMMPGATYTFPGNEVFEIPATRGFINYDTREGNIIGGLSHTSNNVTLTANGVLPYGKLDPYQFFKGALGFGIEGRVGDTSFGIGVDKPFVSNPFTGEDIYTPIQPKIKIKHSFEEGGDLPQAQVGTAIRKGLQALKNFRKSPEITDDLVNTLSQSDEFKVLDSQIPNVNQTKTIVNDVVDQPYIDINTVKTIEQRAFDFIEKEIIKKADKLPKGITLDQVNHATGEIIVSSKKLKPFTYNLNKTEQKRLTDFFFKQADKEGLFKPKIQSKRQMDIDEKWFYNPTTKRMETRGSFLGISGYTPDRLDDGRNFIDFLNDIDQKVINRGSTINPNPAEEKFYLGIDRIVADRFLNTLEKFGVKTITGKQLKTIFPEGFYHGSPQRINSLEDITLQPKTHKVGESGFYGTANPKYANRYMDWTKEIGPDRNWWDTSYGPAKNRTLHSIDIADDAVVGFSGGKQIQGGYKGFEDFKDEGVDIVLGDARPHNRGINFSEILFLNKKGIKNFKPIEPSTSILGQGTKIDDLINLDPTAHKLMMSGKKDEALALLDKYYKSYGKSPLGPTVELPGGINAIEGGIGMDPVGGYGWNLKDIPKLDLMLDTRYGPKIKLPHRWNPDLDQYFRISREGPLWKEGGDLPKAQSGLFKLPKAILKYFTKTVDDIPVSSGTLANKIDLDKTFSGNTTSTISKFSDEIENPNKLSIDNIEGDLIRRDKGKYLTFDENGNLISTARSTHFTGTGAPVETHFMGNWDDAVTTIDLPLKDAIKANPGQIRTSAIGDTYFYETFNYPKSANIFTGDYQLFNQLKKSGYNVELSKESMDIFRQINSLRPKIINETATAAEKELFEKLVKQNADIHNQFIKSRNLTAVNPNDPNIELGWEQFNPHKTDIRSIRSDRLTPYVHFEQFPDYNIQALGRKFEEGMFGKYLSPDQIVQPRSYQIENIPTSSDLKIFQKEVLEGWTDDYAKRWLETYNKQGYDTPFGDLMKNIVEEKLNKNLPYLQYYDGGSLPKAQSGLFKLPKVIAKYFGKTVDDIPINTVDDIKITNNTFTGKTEPSKITNTFIKSFDDRTQPTRGGILFDDGVGEYNSLLSMYKQYPDNVAQPFNLITKEGVPSGYTMENIIGQDLATYLDNNNKFTQQMYDKINQVVRNLNAKGLYHGDLNARNIMIDNAGNFKIIDPVGFEHSSKMSDELLEQIKNLDIESLENLKRYIKKYGGKLKKFQDAGEYNEDGYKTVTYGANKKKYQDTGTWSEFEPYETYSGKTWRKRTYELSRDDLRYLEHKKSFLTDVNYRSGKNNPPKNLTQFIRNSSKPWRVQEIIKDNGATQYVLQYPTATGSFKTFALGDENSGLANLNPEYVQELKRTGKTGITQFSSWFDMTPQERKDYGYSEWFDKGFTRDLKIDKDGNTRSGWNYYNETAPLTYTLSDVEIRKLPRSIVQKYNLVGNDKMKLDPNTGEIDFLTSTGGLRKVVSQKDMQWFQNPGRLKELATDSRFNYKEDNILDYLNNPDFRYFADSQKVTLDPVKLDGVPTENNMSLKKPKPYESTITLEPKTLDQIETEREDEIIKRRPYEAPISLDPVEFKGFSDKEQEIIKSNPYESAITLDKKEIEEIPVDEGSLIERRMQETPITLDPINVTGIDSDGTVTTDGSKQRFVPKSDIEADMPEIVLTPGMEEERDKAKTIEDIMGNLQNVKGTTKYVSKSAKAILDAINRDDYTEKDLSRDLGIFEKYYGQENLGYLQDMLDKSQGPKANKGVEVLEDGKFNVKMDRLNNIIDKYYAGEQLSAAENEEIKLYDLRSNDEVDIQPEENNETDLLVDNKSYNLADQIYIYNQYLDDAFTSDDEEKSGNKIVDKINRVYYNKAKQKNMHVYDLLLAIENEMKQ